ncbi:hypothetical protein QTN25_002593 [Entamoeba marina]
MDNPQQHNINDDVKRKLKTSVKKNTFVLQQTNDDDDSPSSHEEETMEYLLSRKPIRSNPIDKFRQVKKSKKVVGVVIDDQNKQTDKVTSKSVLDTIKEMADDESKNNKMEIEHENDINENDINENVVVDEKQSREPTDLTKQTTEGVDELEFVLYEDKEAEQPKLPRHTKSEMIRKSQLKKQTKPEQTVNANEKEELTRFEKEIIKKTNKNSQHKKKKKKTRSRMKNIKKDKRPDHLKPDYLKTNI